MIIVLEKLSFCSWLCGFLSSQQDQSFLHWLKSVLDKGNSINVN